MISLAALFSLTYIAFILFSDSINPFTKPKLQMNRPGWRYGRRMAFAAFVGGLCTLSLMKVLLLPLAGAAIIGAAVTVLMGLTFSARKIGHVLRR